MQHNISGSTLTEQLATAISLISKMGLENLGKITIVMAVNGNKLAVMEVVINSIFSDSQTDVFVTDSKTTH